MLHFQAGVEANPKEYIGCPISLFLHCHLWCAGVTLSIELLGISLFLVLEKWQFPADENDKCGFPVSNFCMAVLTKDYL